MAKPTKKAASEPEKDKGGRVSAQLAQKQEGEDSRQLGAKRNPGRPSIYSEELADEICERLIQGQSLITICRDAHMPDRVTVCRWQAKDARFATRLAYAREHQADTLAEEALEIADNPAGDYVQKADGTFQLNWENVQRSKLKCDMRRWYAAKIAPRKYGERVTQEHTGPGGGAVLLDRPKTDAEVQAEIRRMLADNEREMGLPAVLMMTTQERLARVIQTERPMTPELYRYLQTYQGRAN